MRPPTSPCVPLFMSLFPSQNLNLHRGLSDHSNQQSIRDWLGNPEGPTARAAQALPMYNYPPPFEEGMSNQASPAFSESPVMMPHIQREVKNRGRRRGPLSSEQKTHAKRIRASGACAECRGRKTKVSARMTLKQWTEVLMFWQCVHRLVDEARSSVSTEVSGERSPSAPSSPRTSTSVQRNEKDKDLDAANGPSTNDQAETLIGVG